MRITVTLPRLPAGAASNVLGLLGLVAVVVAIGGLTGNVWWSVLSGGLFAVALAVLAQLGEDSAAAAPTTVAAATVRPRSVPTAAAGSQ
jgi:hypothetical protein